MTNLERRTRTTQDKRLHGLCRNNNDTVKLNDMLNKCDFRCVLKVENVRDRQDLVEECSKHVVQRRQEHGRQWLSAGNNANIDNVFCLIVLNLQR